MQRLDLRIARVVLSVLDSQDGVVRQAAITSDGRKLPLPTLQFGYNSLQGVGIFVHTSILDKYAELCKTFLTNSFVG